MEYSDQDHCAERSSILCLHHLTSNLAAHFVHTNLIHANLNINSEWDNNTVLPDCQPCSSVFWQFCVRWQAGHMMRWATVWPQQTWAEKWVAAWLLCPFPSSSETMSRGPRPTSVPSGTLTHPTVWPQYTNVTDRQDNGSVMVTQETVSIIIKGSVLQQEEHK